MPTNYIQLSLPTGRTFKQQVAFVLMRLAGRLDPSLVSKITFAPFGNEVATPEQPHFVTFAVGADVAKLTQAFNRGPRDASAEAGRGIVEAIKAYEDGDGRLV